MEKEKRSDGQMMMPAYIGLSELFREMSMKGGKKKMETKSRYEVIAGLEAKKRDLIEQRDGLDIVLKSHEKKLRLTEREKSDEVLEYDRRIEDIKDEIETFKSGMKEHKETIKELIKSVDDSLARFSRIEKK